MTKVVVRKLGGNRTRASRSSLVEKRVRNRQGRLEKVLSIDSNSKSFSSDLLRVFEKNVARARSENKKKFGNPDRVSNKA